jgi:NADPH:quinone reductase-like Zn-dependent oxidoreductase
MDWSGVIYSVGEGVTEWNVGDKVFGINMSFEGLYPLSMFRMLDALRRSWLD